MVPTVLNSFSSDLPLFSSPSPIYCLLLPSTSFLSVFKWFSHFHHLTLGFPFLYTSLYRPSILFLYFSSSVTELVLFCGSSVIWLIFGFQHHPRAPSTCPATLSFFRNQIRSRTQWKEICWGSIQCPSSRPLSFGGVASSPPVECPVFLKWWLRNYKTQLPIHSS